MSEGIKPEGVRLLTEKEREIKTNLNTSHERESKTDLNKSQVWDDLEEWEKKWIERRREEHKEEARRLREAEEEYERFSRSMKVLEPVKKVESILATESSEPARLKMRLRGMEAFKEIPPFCVERIAYDQKAPHFILITPVVEAANRGKAGERLACSLRKALEFQTDEKIYSILEETGLKNTGVEETGLKETDLKGASLRETGEFSIKALDGAEFISLCRIFLSPDQEGQIIIEIQKSSFPYFHGYSFSVEDMVYNYLTWLHSSSGSFLRK